MIALSASLAKPIVLALSPSVCFSPSTSFHLSLCLSPLNAYYKYYIFNVNTFADTFLKALQQLAKQKQMQEKINYLLLSMIYEQQNISKNEKCNKFIAHTHI